MSSCWCPQLERHWCSRLKLNFVQSHETGSGSVMETVCRTSWSCPWSLELNKGNFAWMKWWILPAGRILNLIKSLRINFAFALFQLIAFNRLCTGSFPLLGHIDCLQPVDVRSSKFTCLAPPLPWTIVRRILPQPDNSKTFSVFWHWTRTLPFKTFLPLGLSTSLYFCPFNIFLVSKHFASGCLPPSPPPDLLLALSLIPSCQCGSRRTRAPLAALCVAHTQRHKDTRHTHTPSILSSPSPFFLFSGLEATSPTLFWKASIFLLSFYPCALSFAQHTTQGVHFLPGVESLRVSCLYLCVVSGQMFSPAVRHETQRLRLQGSQVSLEKRTKHSANSLQNSLQSDSSSVIGDRF